MFLRSSLTGVDRRLLCGLHEPFASFSFLAFLVSRLCNALEEVRIDDITRGDIARRAVCGKFFSPFRHRPGAITKAAGRQLAVGNDLGAEEWATGAVRTLAAPRSD